MGLNQLLKMQNDCILFQNIIMQLLFLSYAATYKNRYACHLKFELILTKNKHVFKYEWPQICHIVSILDKVILLYL